MDTISAFVMGEANRGKTQMVFDWDKAASLIKKNKPKIASAGLRDDWEYTGGTIYENGKIVTDSYTYLASTWATPELDMDGKIIPCFVMGDKTKWNSNTKWPESAQNILSPKKNKSCRSDPFPV